MHIYGMCYLVCIIILFHFFPPRILQLVFAYCEPQKSLWIYTYTSAQGHVREVFWHFLRKLIARSEEIHCFAIFQIECVCSYSNWVIMASYIFRKILNHSKFVLVIMEKHKSLYAFLWWTSLTNPTWEHGDSSIVCPLQWYPWSFFFFLTLIFLLI